MRRPSPSSSSSSALRLRWVRCGTSALTPQIWPRRNRYDQLGSPSTKRARTRCDGHEAAANFVGKCRGVGIPDLLDADDAVSTLLDRANGLFDAEAAARRTDQPRARRLHL